MGLRTKVIKATGWYAGTRLCLQIVTWVVSILLARLLTPADYGLFAMALAVIGFLELFQEYGLGVAIIQRRDLAREQVNAVFWLMLAASAAIAALTFLAAPVAARLYAEPRLVGLVRMLGLIFLLNGIGMVPYNLLTREIDFRRRSIAEVAAVLTSAVVSISLAVTGSGVWALAIGQLARALVKNGALLLSSGWWPSLRVSFRGMSQLMRFGLRIAGANVASTLSTMANTAIIGRFLGGQSLGYFVMAESLGERNPLHKVSTSLLNQLSLPVFSRLQQDEVQLRAYFLKITKYLAVISLPMQIGMALVARDLIEVLLTAKWAPVAGLVQVFAIGGVLSVLPLPSTPLLTARGRAGVVFRFSAVSAVVMAAAFLIGAQFGLVGVAIGWLIVFPSRRIYLLVLSLRELGLGPRAYTEAILSPVVATAAMAVVVLSSRAALSPHLAALERLAVDVAVGVAAYAATLLLVDRRLGTEMKTIVHEMFATSRA